MDEPTLLEDLATLWNHRNSCSDPKCLVCKADTAAYERLKDFLTTHAAS